MYACFLNISLWTNVISSPTTTTTTTNSNSQVFPFVSHVFPMCFTFFLRLLGAFAAHLQLQMDLFQVDRGLFDLTRSCTWATRGYTIVYRHRRRLRLRHRLRDIIYGITTVINYLVSSHSVDWDYPRQAFGFEKDPLLPREAVTQMINTPDVFRQQMPEAKPQKGKIIWTCWS